MDLFGNVFENSFLRLFSVKVYSLIYNTKVS